MGGFRFCCWRRRGAHGLTVVVAAIREETDAEMDARAAADDGVRVHWMSLGELSKLVETFHTEGVTRAVMAGQVRHKQIFSSIRPDWRLAKLLLSLRTRNTDMLLSAVAKVLGDEGIELISSTAYLEPLLAATGTMSAREANEDELRDVEYGLEVARGIAGYDLGQTVVIAAGACVAVEAMEGTDATIARAGELIRGAGETTLSRGLTVVKVAKPNQDMRFDVPVVGVATVRGDAGCGGDLPVRGGGADAAVRSRGDGGRGGCGGHRDVGAVRHGVELRWRVRAERAGGSHFSFWKEESDAEGELDGWGGWNCGVRTGGDAGSRCGGSGCARWHRGPRRRVLRCPRQTDAMVSLKDYKGKYVVLYFYPKDMTTGCTIEAHNFERDTAKYTALNAVVLGVSLDTVESHKTFCSKDSLNFKLLADPEGKVIAQYGVPVMTRGEAKFAMRDTYLIGPDGKVLKFWQVKDVQAHSDEVLAAIAELKK